MVVKLRQSRFRNVIAVVDGVRAAHAPLLDRPLRIGQLEQILRRERIAVVRLPIEDMAYTVGGKGSYVVVVRSNLSGRHFSRVVAHEYAHIKLHRSPHEIEFDRSQCTRGDPREFEAELFVLLLRLGPSATPDHPDVARLVAKMEAAEYRKREPQQLPLSLPVGVPMYKAPAGPAFDGTGSFNRFAGEPRRRRYQGPKVKVGDSHDSLLFDWTWKGIPLGFFAGNRGWCDIWDTMPAPESTRRSRDVLVCGDRRATWRDFVFSSIERYRYEFAEGETRDRSPKALTRQIERATKLAVSTPISADLIFRARKGHAS